MTTSPIQYPLFVSIFLLLSATSHGNEQSLQSSSQESQKSNEEKPSNDPSSYYENKDFVIEYEMYQDLGQQSQSPETTKQIVKLKGNRRVIHMNNTCSFDDPETGDAITLFHSDKMFLRDSVSKLKEMSELLARQPVSIKTNDDEPQQDSLKFQRTGQTAEINGYETEEYIWIGKGKMIGLPGEADKTTEITVWVAKDDPVAIAVNKRLEAIPENAMAKVASSTNPDYDSLPGLVIRQETITTSVMPGQNVPVKTKSIRTLIAVRQEQVSDAEFTIPSDYVDMMTQNRFPKF